ncbi:MAG: hypothetical protein KDA78_08110 [Planctomycetaceae bacterium]|nr:hypothetical protein [Planctomycetaceae bacterium]
MPLKEDRLSRSLKIAEKSRDLWEKELAKSGTTGKDLKKNPRWRALNAECVKIQNRIKAVEDLANRGASSEESSSED